MPVDAKAEEQHTGTRQCRTAAKHATMETGAIYFFYRPKVGIRHCTSASDIQRAYVLLVPDEVQSHPVSPSRLILIPRKHLPAILSHERLWGTVWKVNHDLKELRRYLLSSQKATKTRGVREIEPARPTGRGVYSIVRDQPHTTHLCYVLAVPGDPGEPQCALGIHHEASYILSVKNPQQSLKPPPRYPGELLRLFGNRAWIGASPPHLLDFEGSEILLIGAHDTVADEAGQELVQMGITMAKLLNPELVLNELHTTSAQLPPEPLWGEWV